jgi:hypothetical protein
MKIVLGLYENRKLVSVFMKPDMTIILFVRVSNPKPYRLQKSISLILFSSADLTNEKIRINSFPL